MGYGLPTTLVAAVVVATIVHVLTTAHVAAWVAPVELTSTVIFALAIAGGLLRFASGDPTDRSVLRLGLWFTGGAVLFAVTVAALVYGQTAVGGIIQEPLVTVAITALGGGVVAFLVGIYDIDHQRAVERSEALSRRLGFVNRTLRHDVRNDATVIVGNAELLKADVGPSEELDYIAEAASHIVDLTHLVRAFEAAEDIVELEPVDLAEMLERCVEHSRSSFPAATFDVHLHEGEALVVRADKLLSSVFENLFRNAVQHNDRDEPHVEVDVATLDDLVRIEIADDGPGIPPSVQESLFQEGIKGPRSTGTGLGLYLVRELVTAFDGSVSARAREPRGTVVTVELPRA